MLLSHLKTRESRDGVGRRKKINVDSPCLTVTTLGLSQPVLLKFYPVPESKHPASVMVFGVVPGDGHIMPPHFVPSGQRIGTTECLWASGHPGGDPDPVIGAAL